MGEEKAKIGQLRNNEYYCMQEKLDWLNKRSKDGYVFHDLMKHINEDHNIRLAYRNIKNNSGSKAKGLSGKNMDFISNLKLKKYLRIVKQQLENYTPSTIKRVGIPKANGKVRYLGIKEPIDKIVEQAIYQILNPIITPKANLMPISASRLGINCGCEIMIGIASSLVAIKTDISVPRVITFCE